MELEQHELKLVLALQQHEPSHRRHNRFLIWIFSFVGLLNIGVEFRHNPDALDDIFNCGAGVFFLMGAAYMWLDLRRRRLIHKLSKRLDKLDSNWAMPRE